ncbi:MAG: TatD family hydrolase [Burkholderiaceae bacterium]|jgi:TatD DNase family protein|nr:putative deoxyribonuclease YjjV [Betaproteobacteria bacterium MOLA814]
MLIDTHCHWDASEFGDAGGHLRAQAQARGVSLCVVPAVQVSNFESVRRWAHTYGDAYALGIHPLFALDATEAHLSQLDQALGDLAGDPRLVAVGEIGIDGFVPWLQTPGAKVKMHAIYRAQLRLARKHHLPVVLHVRKSADVLLKHLRELPVVGGIGHAFNGSVQQAQAFVRMGFVLGFGGTATFETAVRIRRLAATLSHTDLVIETDGPDIPPHWIYATELQRSAGMAQGLNSSVHLPEIAQVVANLRGVHVALLAAQTCANAKRVLPKLDALIDTSL